MISKTYLSFFIGVLVMMLAGCSESSEDIQSELDNGRRLRHLTISPAEESVLTRGLADPTRAQLTDEEDGTLSSIWSKGDKATYCNLSRLSVDLQTIDIDKPTFGDLTAESSAKTSRFSGDANVGTGDFLAFVYPTATFDFSKDPNAAEYTISLESQDGTLQTLAKSYHFVYGSAQVTSVTESTANADLGTMRSLITVCKFSFVDAEKKPITMKSFRICYGGTGTDSGRYPYSATVTAPMTDYLVTLTENDSESPLSVNPPDPTEVVYVALWPTGGIRTFVFEVETPAGDRYRGKANAELIAGQFVNGTGLKLLKN